jgi:hypothetical protein
MAPPPAGSTEHRRCYFLRFADCRTSSSVSWHRAINRGQRTHESPEQQRSGGVRSVTGQVAMSSEVRQSSNALLLEHGKAAHQAPECLGDTSHPEAMQRLAWVPPVGLVVDTVCLKGAPD